MRLRFQVLILALAFGVTGLGVVGMSNPALPQVPTGTGGASSSATPRQPPTYVIRNIRVEGIEDERTKQFVVQSSGLSTGQRITLPAGDAVAEAVRSIYDLGQFSDVSIRREPVGEGGVNLIIELTPEPVLVGYQLRGIDGGDREDLKEKIPLIQGQPALPAEIERAKQIIKEFYADEGYLRTEVSVERQTNAAGQLSLTFNVVRDEEIEVEEIRFSGNEQFDDGDLRGAMEETKENRWWRFWSGEQFNREKYEEDLEKVVDYYREQGYYDAQIVRDSVHYVGKDGLAIDVTVREGEKYYVRNINWEGNTVFPDQVLTQQVGLQEGQPYNGKALDENLYGNREGSDISGMYMNQGYMRANVRPSVRVVGEDSLDITFDVREGDVYTFGEINISGNTKTKDYVIRRELATVPGSRFSRNAIQESIRRLSQLEYFSQESLQGGPEVSVDQDDKEAELTYDVEETGSDQLQLSGTFGQFGLVLQLGFTFNNFSAQNLFNPDAWRPLPSGDGQKLSLNARTNGRFFQSYSISFEEPWFRGNPTPVGGSISYSKFTRTFFTQNATSSVENGSFQNISTSLFVRQRLNWPDDNFMAGLRIGYEFFDNKGFVEDENGERQNVGLFQTIPTGRTNSLTLRTSLSRNSLDNPRFPSSGSSAELSVEVAPPMGGFAQYHKWKFDSSWNVPLGENFSFGMGADFGYIGSLTGEEVEFERFEVGGTPFDFQGQNFGTDPVFVRGYPRGVIGPKEQVLVGGGNTRLEPAGAQIFNKFTSELRWMATSSQQLRARPYIFYESAGAFRGPESFNPTNTFDAGGIGVKLYLPIVGMIEVNYGYNFDAFQPIESGDTGEKDWTFQFSIGQGF